MINKTAIKTLPDYFDRYINLVEDIEITIALEKYGNPLIDAEADKLYQLGDKVYADGKWTVKDLLQHIIDTERVFNYRAVRFSRGDQTILPGYDENNYAITAQANQRKLEDLIAEFKAVRLSTIALYKSFDEEMMHKEGICFDKKISVLSIGFTVCGHLIHHLGVLKERYYPLLDS